MRNIKNIELFKINFLHRMPTFLFIFMTIIPFFLFTYMFYWIPSRINSFNKITKNKISIAWSITYILLIPIGLFLANNFIVDTMNSAIENAGFTSIPLVK